MKTRLILSTLLILVALTLNGQTKMDSVTTYIHQEPVSFQAKLLQSIIGISGLKNRIEKDLIKGGFSQKASSIPKSIQKKYNINIEIKNDRPIWTLKPKQNGTEKVILYLHGGAYIYNITKQHWQMIEAILIQTNATVVVPDYPLAPTSTYINAFECIEYAFSVMTKNIRHENIILMGDSAGAGLALSFAQKLRDENNSKQPSQIILLSPWLDITMTNPAIIEIDKKDKILGIKGLQLAGKAYSGELNTQDYKVSPIYGDLKGLGQISVFTGTNDLLIADARQLKQIAKTNSIELNYFEYPNMFHDWIIITSLRESQHALKQINLIINGINPYGFNH
jgi:acetyl esterase/lipase